MAAETKVKIETETTKQTVTHESFFATFDCPVCKTHHERVPTEWESTTLSQGRIEDRRWCRCHACGSIITLEMDLGGENARIADVLTRRDMHPLAHDMGLFE